MSTEHDEEMDDAQMDDEQMDDRAMDMDEEDFARGPATSQISELTEPSASDVPGKRQQPDLTIFGFGGQTQESKLESWRRIIELLEEPSKTLKSKAWSLYFKFKDKDIKWAVCKDCFRDHCCSIKLDSTKQLHPSLIPGSCKVYIGKEKTTTNLRTHIISTH